MNSCLSHACSLSLIVISIVIGYYVDDEGVKLSKWVCMCVIVQNVYWSDVRERTIRRVKLDQSAAAELLLDSSKGIGVVDGKK